MSQENVELVREAWEASMRGDPTRLDLSLFDPDVVYEDDILPDHSEETYRGHEGVQRAWTRATEPWESMTNEIEWTRDAGDEIVTCHRAWGRGRESRVEVEIRYAYVWRFREGKVIYLKSYSAPDEALKAAGLQE